MVNKTQDLPTARVDDERAARDEADKQAFERVIESRRQAMMLAETKWSEQCDGLISQLQRCSSPNDNAILPSVIVAAASLLQDWMTAYDQASEEYYAARRALRRLRGEPEDS